MAGSKPTQRTLDACRKFGWFATGVVERYDSFSHRRHDLIGCIDIVTVPHHGCLGIQACRDGDHAAHRSKAIGEPRLMAWLDAGNTFEIWSWGRRGAAGKRKTWTLRREEIRPVDMAPEVKCLYRDLSQLTACHRCIVFSEVLTDKRCAACAFAWARLDCAFKVRKKELEKKK